MNAPGKDGFRALAFVGGGTGGHVFPGIALAERAQDRFPGCRIVFFRTSRKVEDQVFASRNLETRRLEIRAPGRTPLGWWRYALRTRHCRAEIRSVLREGFDALFALGGYPSLAGILAARAEGVPVLCLEQNRVCGRVNRFFASFASAICVSHPGVRVSGRARVVYTGNPVRKEVLLAAAAREANRAARSRDVSEPRTVLVVGGSQGALGLNRALRRSLEGLSRFRERIHWIHLAGDADKMNMEEAYANGGWSARVLGFSSDLPRLMCESDLVIARSGGTTLAELAVIGVPSVLVPYPHHRDAHQLENARHLVDGGAAVLVSEASLDGEALGGILDGILFEPERLEAMSARARGLARPDAADAILNLASSFERPCPQHSGSSSS